MMGAITVIASAAISALVAYVVSRSICAKYFVMLSRSEEEKLEEMKMATFDAIDRLMVVRERREPNGTRHQNEKSL